MCPALLSSRPNSTAGTCQEDFVGFVSSIITYHSLYWQNKYLNEHLRWLNVVQRATVCPTSRSCFSVSAVIIKAPLCLPVSTFNFIVCWTSGSFVCAFSVVTDYTQAAVSPPDSPALQCSTSGGLSAFFDCHCGVRGLSIPVLFTQTVKYMWEECRGYIVLQN